MNQFIIDMRTKKRQKIKNKRKKEFFICDMQNGQRTGTYYKTCDKDEALRAFDNWEDVYFTEIEALYACQN